MTTLLPSGDAMSLDGRPERLRTIVQQMGGLVGHAMDQLAIGFSQQDGESSTVMIATAELEDLHREARDLCFSRLLSPVPMTADDLRWMIRTEEVATEFKRMGDHCVRVASITRDLVGLSTVPLTTNLSALASACAKQVSDIVSALASEDHDRAFRARLVASTDTHVDLCCQRVFENLNASRRSGAKGALPATQLRLAAHHIDRVAEHVRNVAEHLVDAETGRIEALP
jgi:phosphate transport system protein